MKRRCAVPANTAASLVRRRTSGTGRPTATACCSSVNAMLVCAFQEVRATSTTFAEGITTRTSHNTPTKSPFGCVRRDGE